MLLSVQSPLPDALFVARALPPGPGSLPHVSAFATVFNELSALGVKDAGVLAPAAGPLEGEDESEGVEPSIDPPAPEGEMADVPLLAEAPMVALPKTTEEETQIADAPAAITMQPTVVQEKDALAAPADMGKSAQPPAAIVPALAPLQPNTPGSQPAEPSPVMEGRANSVQAPPLALTDSSVSQPGAPRISPSQPEREQPLPAQALAPDAPAPQEISEATPTAKVDPHLPASPPHITARTAVPITPTPEIPHSLPVRHLLQERWGHPAEPLPSLAPPPPKPLLRESVKPPALLPLGLAPADHTNAPARMETNPPTSAPEPPARQILQAIQALPPLPPGGTGRIEVVLSPAELGRVEITLTPKDATTVISFTAERPETADLLRRNIDMLLEDLRKLGFGEAEFSFAGNRGQSAPRAPQFDTESPTISHITPTRAPGNGRLDLRM